MLTMKFAIPIGLGRFLAALSVCMSLNESTQTETHACERAPDLQVMCDAHFLCALECTASHARRINTSNMSPAAQVQTHLSVLKQLPAAQQYLDRCDTALPHPVYLPQLIMSMYMQAMQHNSRTSTALQ